MTTSLCVSLGHNSSAVLVHGSDVAVGYEQERLDRRKSSSSYPTEAIDLCIDRNLGLRVDVAYVGHWFDRFDLASNKYLDMDHLQSVCQEVVGLSNIEFTHHDSHAQSALSFYRSVSGRQLEDADIVVLDGFGNNQECLSVYRARGVPGSAPALTHRTFGYRRSLGLMYQYTTLYLGLKMNQDEYKLLGYESHVLEHIPHAKAAEIRRRMSADAEEHVNYMLFPTTITEPGDELIDREELEIAKSMWTQRCIQWRKALPSSLNEDGVRACIAFCAQTFLEECVCRLVEELCPVPMGGTAPALILTGGCFYNVKLNRRVMTYTNRKIFPHPLSGDQGAALGFLPGVNAQNLTWGHRRIGERSQLPVGVYVCEEGEWVRRAIHLLGQDRIVNVVRGGMEFGPRALCNTTTFALPTRENVRRINALNERDEFMPMAPVMTGAAANSLLWRGDVEKTIHANRFMITTCAFGVKPPPELMGVAHRDPIDEVWTARPQLVGDFGDLGKLLGAFEYETLINTSFNYHGEPIVFTEDDACKTHEMQCFRAQQLDMVHPVTLLVRS